MYFTQCAHTHTVTFEARTYILSVVVQAGVKMMEGLDSATRNVMLLHDNAPESHTTLTATAILC